MTAKASVASQEPGANNPPPEAAMSIAVDALIKVADEWAVKVPKITDESTAAQARDFVAKIADEENVVETERMRQRRPHLDANEAIQKIFVPMATRLDLAKKKLLGILKTWQDAEKARIAKEAAEAETARQKAISDAAEAALAAHAQNASIDDIVFAQEAQKTAEVATQTAATAAKAKPAIRGNVVSRALTEHTTWTAEIQDWQATARYFIAANNIALKAEIQRIANAEARDQKADFAIPGATVKKDTHL